MTRGVERPWPLAIVTALLWMAVQAHTTTLPILMAVLSYALFSSTKGGWSLSTTLRRIALVAVVIAVLQVPWLVHRASVGGPGATPMGNSIAAVVRDPLGAPRPVESARALMRAVHVNTAASPVSEIAVVILIAAGSVVLFWRSRDRLLQVVAAGPLLCAIAVYAIWQGALTENYWYLALSLPAALCAFAWMATLGPPARLAVGVALTAAVAWTQPSRAALSQITLRTPIYASLVEGARATLASGYAIRELRTSFDVPEGTDPAYVYTVLGGRLGSRGASSRDVDVSGRVSFETID